MPSFVVDPSWPHEMPDKWIIGSITSVFVDSQDHVWITHQPEVLTPEEAAMVQDPPIGTCCTPAPTVIEFDSEGDVVQAWGDTSQDISVYPRNPHGLFVDHNDYVWIGTFRHHRVMKFTRTGEHLLTIGKYDENGGSDHETLLGGPAGIWVDPDSNEAFIADGYRNRPESSWSMARRENTFASGAHSVRRPMTTTNMTTVLEHQMGLHRVNLPPFMGLPDLGTDTSTWRTERGNRIQVFKQDGEVCNGENCRRPDVGIGVSIRHCAFS